VKRSVKRHLDEAARRVAPGDIALNPPLLPAWSLAGVSGPVLVVGGTELVLSQRTPDHAVLLAVTPAGSSRWRRSGDFEVIGLSARGEVVVNHEVRGRQQVEFVDAATGETVATSKRGRSATCIAQNGTVLAFGEGRHLVSLDNATLLDRWLCDVQRVASAEDAAFDSDVATDGRSCFVGCGSSLVALSLSSGGERWSVDLERHGGVPAVGGYRPMVTADVAIVGTATGLAGFASKDGTVRWTAPLSGAWAAAGAHVYGISSDGRLRVLELTTGRAVSTLTTDQARAAHPGDNIGAGTTAPGVSRTHVFFGDSRGFLWGFGKEPRRSDWSWQCPKGETVVDVPVPMPGHLLVRTMGRTMQATLHVLQEDRA
jgi:outer membrane protein assembly factor BamB